MAKFPPDDDLPGTPLGAGANPYDMGAAGDGDFKKGNKGKLIAVVAVVAALGGGAFFAMSGGDPNIEMTVDDAAAKMKDIFVMPKDQQVVEWRKWAATPGDQGGLTEIKQEALKQLAWAKDPEGVNAAIALLKSPSPKLQSMAATVLSHYGPKMAESAKPALLEAFKTAGEGSKPQIAWALVVLGEGTAFEDILALYRKGHLATVQRLGGGSAFDPTKLVDMVPVEKIQGLAGDESDAVRQLVATVLSRHAEARFTDTLIQLLGDKNPEVARMAAPGLGKIGDKRARDPLIARLKDADKESREKYLDALRKGVGGEGLVLALYANMNEEDPAKKWYFKVQVFGLIDELNDPRAGDALFEYLQVEEHIHWQFRTAMALGAIGDVRAVPTLAKRLRMDPQKIYSDDYDWEMLIKRDGKERVEAARMIADLARMQPDKVELMRKQAEDALIFWNKERTEPHANGLRALAALGSTKDIGQMRDWAFPSEPLPKEGQQPPMPSAFVIAQSALRYIGMLQDKSSWTKLVEQLKKKPDDLSIANESMYQGGMALLGMSLNAIGKGAADGLSEWADPKGFEPLLEFVIDTKQNENARESACAALAWTSDSETIMKVAEKIAEYKSQEPADSFRRKCLLETLVQRPVPGTAGALLTLMTGDQAIETRTNLARAIAKAGIDQATQDKLFELTSDPALMNDAVLALALGGSPDAAARAIALYADKDKVAVESLHDMWFRSFGFWSTEDLEQGVLFRYVDNAEAISRVIIKATPQVWAADKLTAQFDNLIYDNGPHSFTRVVLRNRLFAMAQGSDAVQAAGAVRTLKFMKEIGTLMALRDGGSSVAKQAGDAVFELENPNYAASAATTPTQAELK